MNEVKVFDNLKVKEENEQILFDAETAAIGLGISEVAKSGNTVVKWTRINKYLGIDTSVDNGIKRGDFITEPQFYKLAIKANNETAEKFQDWVTSEVLPAIRKHGTYMTDQTIEEVLTNPDTIIRLATDLKNERKEKLMLAQQVTELKPKADYTDLILSNKTLVTITFIAKDYGMSGLAMNKLLHDLGVQYSQSGVWLLYAKHQTKGWTQSETTEVVRKDGSKKLVMNTKWTQKGRLGLYELLKDNGYLPLIEQDQPA
ncbi:phage antirepressor KilAC domain-containing protein [Leuconostoc lactis]|uniref:phage antirepressor KilAC domain-containing protein n=1 Tax=Leuconostoc lactis TaxID=1246 RepID=UPI00272AC888|nr:phage antirepressor KilAC domain-containing protein [Leuconostoc lactis]WKY79090.1 phage antirepressor KilAC domain-containing protein [Leuconostoc lactis]